MVTNNNNNRNAKSARPAAKKERQYLTAVTVEKGIITLIDPDGEIKQYRQRGIGRIDPRYYVPLIKAGFLVKDWKTYKELPAHYSIEFEDEEIMGKARATFPDPAKLFAKKRK